RWGSQYGVVAADTLPTAPGVHGAVSQHPTWGRGARHTARARERADLAEVWGGARPLHPRPGRPGDRDAERGDAPGPVAAPRVARPACRLGGHGPGQTRDGAGPLARLRQLGRARPERPAVRAGGAYARPGKRRARKRRRRYPPFGLRHRDTCTVAGLRWDAE